MDLRWLRQSYVSGKCKFQLYMTVNGFLCNDDLKQSSQSHDFSDCLVTACGDGDCLTMW